MDDGKTTAPIREGLPPVLARPAAPALTPMPAIRDDGPAARYEPGNAALPPLPGGVVSRFQAATVAAIAAERDRGLAFLFLPVALGTGAAIAFSLPRDPPLWPFAVACAVLAVLAIVAARRGSAVAVALRLAAAMAAGVVFADIEAAKGPVLLDSDVTTTITGRVERVEIDTAGAARYLLALEATAEPRIMRPPQRIRVTTRSTDAPHEVGSRITGRARLSRPSGPAYPGGFDFAFSAFTTGIGAHGFFFAAPVRADGAGAPPSRAERFAATISALRGAIATRIRAVIPGDAGGIAAALTVSDRRGISEPVAEAMRVTGLTHILSISGLHMALAAGLSFVGLRRLMALSPRIAETLPVKKFAAFGALGVSSGYFLISGGDVATQRAYLMVMVLLGAAIMDRAVLTMRNIALSAIVIILVVPSSISSPGFQMSYAATAALIAAHGAWWRWREGRQVTPAHKANGLPGSGVVQAIIAGLVGLAVTSLVAGAASGLYAAFHFHRASFAGLVANLIAMPLVSFVVMPAGLVAMLAMPFGLDALPLKLMGYGLDGVISVATGIASLGGEAKVGKLPTHAVIVATAGFLLVVFLRGRLALAGGLVLAAGLVLTLPPFRPPPPRLVVSEAGTLVGILSDATFATNAAKPPDFTFRQWTSAYRAPGHVAPAMLERPEGETTAATRLERLLAAARAGEGRFACDSRTACAAAVDGIVVVAIGEVELIGAACDLADLVILSRPVRMAECHSGGLLVTARSLRRTGSLAIRIRPEEGGGATPKGAREAKGRLEIETAIKDVVRPWTIQRYYDWRADRYDLPGERPPQAAAAAAPTLNGSGG